MANIPAVPNNFVNGVTSDANQVDTNFSALVASVNALCAALGANSDITSLSALSTPLSTTQGGTGSAAITGSGLPVFQTGPTIASPAFTGPVTSTGAVVVTASGNIFNYNSILNASVTIGMAAGSPGYGLTLYGYSNAASNNGLQMQPVANVCTDIVFNNGSGSERGAITGTASATTFATSSDVRLKTNIMPLEDGLKAVMAMKPVEFGWRDHPDEPRATGFIAQWQAEVGYEGVVVGDDKRPWSYQYGRNEPRLVAAIQDLAYALGDAVDQIADLRKELDALKKETSKG